MNPVPLLALLGIATLLCCAQALNCQRGKADTVRDVSELPFNWTAGRKTCKTGEGCQDMLMLIENGPQVNLVLIKDCTAAADQEARVTWHRAGPGLSIISYTHVCRHGDFCNDLSTTEALGTLPTATVPGTLRCPVCLSRYSCPENAPEQTCPAGHTHCYDGVLRLRAADIVTNLRVQGCMPQPGCNLLNGTQKIGPMDVSENCNLKSGVQALECKTGSIETLRDVSELPLTWTTDWKSCEIGEGCQETVMLIQNGRQVNFVLTKGCTKAEDQEGRVTRHRTDPELSIISFTHVCRHGDFCNDLSSTKSLWAPPPATVPGTLRCPVCLSTDDCPENAPEQMCPAGRTHCYDGVVKLRGGSIITNLRVQGCMAQPGCNLLNGAQKIGPIDVSENCDLKSGTQALECRSGHLEVVKQVSELPIEWTTGWKVCGIGEGCQETVMLIENGPQVNFVLTKGCTAAEDQEARVTRHRAGPGLSITSFTSVCRHRDLCNDLSTTEAFWTPPPATVPGTLRCPVCLSRYSCPENAPEQTCPAGHTHCYDGVLRLSGGNIVTKLRVQGCMPQAGCNLLNGTQKIGPIDVSENCDPKSDTLTCHRGIMLKLAKGLGQEPAEWTTSGMQTCSAGEVCQETLLLIDVGPRSLLAGSKGCSGAGAKDSQPVSIYSHPPGMVVASYARFCNSDFCNRASSSSVLLNSLPRPAAPPQGHLQCPVCVQFSGSCSDNSNFVTCPNGTTHCYNGDIEFRGGGLSATFGIQGCMASVSRSLLNDAQTIGVFSVRESYEGMKEKKPESLSPSGVAPSSCLAWLVGLALSLALWCGGLCSLC